MRSKVIAKTVIQNDKMEVLLLRRSGTDPRRPLEWDFPGGGIEASEDISLGASREILEETGLEITPSSLSLVYAATEAYQNRESVTRILFLSKAPAGEVRLSFEHDQYKWVDVDMALELFPHPFYGAGLRYARDNKLL